MESDVERPCFDVLSELFARDIDMELLRRAQARTPTERIRWLEGMQEFAEQARKARSMRVRELLDRLAEHQVRFSVIGGGRVDRARGCSARPRIWTSHTRETATTCLVWLRRSVPSIRVCLGWLRICLSSSTRRPSAAASTSPLDNDLGPSPPAGRGAGTRVVRPRRRCVQRARDRRHADPGPHARGPRALQARGRSAQGPGRPSATSAR